MTWTDRLGHAIPYDAVFAAQLWGLKRRMGSMMSRSQQRVKRDLGEREQTSEVIVRTAAGTHVYTEEEPRLRVSPHRP